MLSVMWVLDPANSPELLARLRPHSLDAKFEIIWCGEGWKSLISSCHHELVAQFPDYRFHAIKQTFGVLVFQARPEPGRANDEDLARAHEITERYGNLSRTVCEWCGSTGSLRTDRPEWLTLCDACASDIVTTRYPRAAPGP